jgi:hypothetical protein
MKKLLIFSLLMFCLSTIYAQNKPKPKTPPPPPPKPIKISGDIKILDFSSLPSEKIPPPPPPPRLDSAELDSMMQHIFCSNLGKTEQTANRDVTVNVLLAVSETFKTKKEEEQTALFQWLKFQTAQPFETLDYREVTNILVKKVVYHYMERCPNFNNLLQFDGFQRPAYAHFTQQACNCISRKQAQFEDKGLALLKYGFIRDSCFRDIFKDEDNLKIAYEANDFKTKAQVDSFDSNFGGYFFLNCRSGFDFVYSDIQNRFDAAQRINPDIFKQKFAEPAPQDLAYTGRQATIQTILPRISSLGSGSDKRPQEVFKSQQAYNNALPALNSASALIKPQKIADYMLDQSVRSDGVSEIRLTFYKFNASTQRKDILCQVVFEFEEQDENVAVFRFIPKSQIANLAKLEQRLKER